MSLPTQHIRHQGPVLRTLGATAIAALRQSVSGAPPSASAPSTPSVEHTATVAAPDTSLVRDYLRRVGGDPASYRGRIPGHLWPHWGFPLAARTLQGIPYPLFKVLNGGARLEFKGSIPAGVPLLVRARLEDIDDNGRRAVLHQRVTTGTAADPEALVAHVYAIVPLGGGPASGKAGKPSAPRERVRVPVHARELARWKLPIDEGLAFAMLTGDFNPVHWSTTYARAFGFRNRILHGFATMARAYEGIVRRALAGQVDRVATFDVKFTRPLVLPARVGLYTHEGGVWVGDAPGGPAYLAGEYTLRD